MAKIQLVTITQYAEAKNINRSTVWRQLEKDELDYYVVEGSNKRWLRLKEPDYAEKERNAINQVLYGYY